MRPPCSAELDREDARPYFVWDQAVTVAGVRRALREGSESERLEWTARILREARFDDVWRFLEVSDVVARWPALERRLGRRRAFWRWILERWRVDGLV